MGLPTLLRFQRRQKILKHIVRTILDRVILEAQRAGQLGKTIDTRYDVLFPEIDCSDHQVLASAMDSLVNALGSARERGWVSDETAMRLLFQLVGADVDVHAEREQIAQEEEVRHATR